jgi:hypothetical protein
MSILGEIPNQLVDDLDPLQKDVDPKLLVSSRGKGPSRRRKFPAHMPPAGKVNVHQSLLHPVCAS